MWLIYQLSKPRKQLRTSTQALPWGPLQVGARLEKTDGLLLGRVEKNDILVALSFHLEAPGKDAPVAFVWGETGRAAAGGGVRDCMGPVGMQGQPFSTMSGALSQAQGLGREPEDTQSLQSESGDRALFSGIPQSGRRNSQEVPWLSVEMGSGLRL